MLCRVSYLTWLHHPLHTYTILIKLDELAFNLRLSVLLLSLIGQFCSTTLNYSLLRSVHSSSNSDLHCWSCFKNTIWFKWLKESDYTQAMNFYNTIVHITILSIWEPLVVSSSQALSTIYQKNLKTQQSADTNFICSKNLPSHSLMSVWHDKPLKPGLQSHVKLLMPSIQVPLLQPCDGQSSILFSHSVPLNPVTQVQLKLPIKSMQVPLFSQGFVWHSSISKWQNSP